MGYETKVYRRWTSELITVDSDSIKYLGFVFYTGYLTRGIPQGFESIYDGVDYANDVWEAFRIYDATEYYTSAYSDGSFSGWNLYKSIHINER